MRPPAGPVATSGRLNTLIAGGWALLIAAVYLCLYDGWVIPVQAVQLLRQSSSAFRPGPYLGARLQDLTVAIGVIGAIIAAAFPSGALILSRFTARRDRLMSLYAVATGLWIVAVLVMLFGAIAIRFVPLALLAGLGWISPTARSFLRSWQPSAAPSNVRVSMDLWEWTMVIGLLIAAGASAVGALLPPFEYDVLEYHLGALADYQRLGHIGWLPHNFYSNLPQLTEMLYLLCLCLKSEIATALLHWCFGAATAGVIYLVARRFWTRRVALTAMALFYCVPFLQDLSFTARIDLATTFYSTLAFVGLAFWSNCDDDQDWLWLGSLAAGGAVATKWTAIPIVMFSAVGFILVRCRMLRPAANFASVAAVFALPWLIKNWMLTGNPVYPLFHEWFPTSTWSDGQAALFASKHYPQFDAAGWRELAERLWRYSFTEPGAVPLLLMTAPLLLFTPKIVAQRTILLRFVGLFIAAYLAWYLFTFRPWRFLFPCFAIIAVVGAVAVETHARIVKGCLVVILCCSVLTMALRPLLDLEDETRPAPRLSMIHYALGQVGRDEMIRRIGKGSFDPIVWMNQHLPAAAHVLYIGEARLYYARHHAQWSTAFDQHPLERIYPPATLKDHGITHIYINFSELRRLSAGYGYLDNVAWDELRRYLQQPAHAREIYQSGRGVVYQLEN